MRHLYNNIGFNIFSEARLVHLEGGPTEDVPKKPDVIPTASGRVIEAPVQVPKPEEAPKEEAPKAEVPMTIPEINTLEKSEAGPDLQRIYEFLQKQDAKKEVVPVEQRINDFLTKQDVQALGDISLLTDAEKTELKEIAKKMDDMKLAAISRTEGSTATPNEIAWHWVLGTGGAVMNVELVSTKKPEPQPVAPVAATPEVKPVEAVELKPRVIEQEQAKITDKTKGRLASLKDRIAARIKALKESGFTGNIPNDYPQRARRPEEVQASLDLLRNMHQHESLMRPNEIRLMETVQRNLYRHYLNPSFLILKQSNEPFQKKIFEAMELAFANRDKLSYREVDDRIVISKREPGVANGVPDGFNMQFMKNGDLLRADGVPLITEKGAVWDRDTITIKKIEKMGGKFDNGLSNSPAVLEVLAGKPYLYYYYRTKLTPEQRQEVGLAPLREGAKPVEMTEEEWQVYMDKMSARARDEVPEAVKREIEAAHGIYIQHLRNLLISRNLLNTQKVMGEALFKNYELFCSAAKDQGTTYEELFGPESETKFQFWIQVNEQYPDLIFIYGDKYESGNTPLFAVDQQGFIQRPKSGGGWEPIPGTENAIYNKYVLEHEKDRDFFKESTSGTAQTSPAKPEATKQPEPVLPDMKYFSTYTKKDGTEASYVTHEGDKFLINDSKPSIQDVLMLSSVGEAKIKIGKKRGEFNAGEEVIVTRADGTYKIVDKETGKPGEKLSILKGDEIVTVTLYPLEIKPEVVAQPATPAPKGAVEVKEESELAKNIRALVTGLDKQILELLALKVIPDKKSSLSGKAILYMDGEINGKKKKEIQPIGELTPENQLKMDQYRIDNIVTWVEGWGADYLPVLATMIKEAQAMKPKQIRSAIGDLRYNLVN